jgi:hypothetical protein
MKSRIQRQNPKTIEELKAVLCEVSDGLAFATVNKLVP